MPAFTVRTIGTIRTRHMTLEDTPVQAALNADELGTIQLDTQYVDATDGLVGFSHAWLVTWLGPADGSEPPTPELRQVPFLLRRSGQQVGILAMRGPSRPNPIGLSLVRLVEVDGARIVFAGVDMLDGTPLLDVKPYFRDVDQPLDDVRCGWFDAVALDGPTTPRELDGP